MLTEQIRNDMVDILLKSASLLEEGWCQGHLFGDTNGNAMYIYFSLFCNANFEDVVARCAIGAIHQATEQLIPFTDVPEQHPRRYRNKLVTDLETHLRLLMNRHSLASWNDDPKRTKEEVIDLFRKAALELSNQKEESHE